MSHVVQVWEQPPLWIYPRQAGTVIEMLDALRRRHPGPNPRFAEFARRLTACHPCITSPKTDDLDESQLAWSTGSLDGRTTSAVYAVGLTTAMLEQTLPLVRQTARALGLSVFDEQAGHVWLANGEELRVDGHPAWHYLPPAYIEVGRLLPDKDALLDRVLNGPSGQALTALGFMPLARDPRDDAERLYASARWRRTSPIGWQEIELRAIDKRPDALHIGVLVEAWVSRLSNWRLETHLAPAPVPSGTRPLSNLSLLRPSWLSDTAALTETGGAGAIVLRSEEDIANVCEMLAEQFSTRLAARLAGFESLPAVTELLVPADLPFSWSPFFQGYVFSADALAAAYLSRSPRVHALIDEVRAHAQPPHPPGNNPGRKWLAAHDAAMLAHVQACIARMEREPLA